MNGLVAGGERSSPSLGPTVLEIGGDLGALVVVTPADLVGAELEIRRPPDPWDGRHVAVRLRPGAGRPKFAGVFGGLRGGTYELRVLGGPGTVVRSVVVRGGEVTWDAWCDIPSAGGTPQRGDSTGQDDRGKRGREHLHAG